MLDEDERLLVKKPADADVDCCFCGRKVTVGYIEDLAVVIHDMPMCHEFNQMDASDFLHECVSKLQN